MSTASIVINSVGNLDWNAQVYGVLSVASRLAISIRKKANVFQLAFSLHKANKALAEFFRTIDAAMEGKLTTDSTAEPITPERVKAMGYTLVQLHQTMTRVCSAMEQAKLLNYSLISGSLRDFRRYSDRILDLADWFEAVQLPDLQNEVFNRADRERQQGDIFDLSQVE